MSFCPVPELKYNKQAIAQFIPSLGSELWDATYGHDSLLIYRFKAQLCPAVLEVCKQIADPLELIAHVELFKTSANLTLPAHIDNGRKVALNVPIVGDFDQTGLDLYSIAHLDASFDVNGARGFKGQAKHIARVSSTVPYLLDTSKPHGTCNPTNQDRVILSITFNSKYSFLDILSRYTSGTLLNDDK